MRNTVRPVVLLAVISIGAWYGWRWFFPNDKARILAVFTRIADGCAGDSSEGDMRRLSRVASLRSELDPNVTVDAAPITTVRGPDAIVRTLANLTRTFPNLDVRVRDVNIHVDPGGQTATATLTAEARFDEREGGRTYDAREFDVSLTRIDGAWVVSTVTLVRTLRRPDQQ